MDKKQSARVNDISKTSVRDTQLIRNNNSETRSEINQQYKTGVLLVN